MTGVPKVETESGSSDDPNHWRCRADNARVEAAAIDEPDLRSLMDKVALGYDLIADSLEQRARERALSLC